MTELEIEFFRGKIKGLIIAHDERGAFGDCLHALDDICKIARDAICPPVREAPNAIEELNLSFRVRNAFITYRVTMDVLMQLNEAELLRIDNIGRKSVREIQAEIALHGLALPEHAKLRWDWKSKDWVPTK